MSLQTTPSCRSPKLAHTRRHLHSLIIILCSSLIIKHSCTDCDFPYSFHVPPLFIQKLPLNLHIWCTLNIYRRDSFSLHRRCGMICGSCCKVPRTFLLLLSFSLFVAFSSSISPVHFSTSFLSFISNPRLCLSLILYFLPFCSLPILVFWSSGHDLSFYQQETFHDVEFL